MKSFAELQALMDKLEGREKELAAFEGLFTELGTAIADVLAHMESTAGQGPELAETIARAIRDLRIAAPAVTVKPPMVNVSAPNVSVNVNPTPVTVQVPEIKPVVQIMPAEQGKGWDFDVSYGPGNVIQGIRATRI